MRTTVLLSVLSGCVMLLGFLAKVIDILVTHAVEKALREPRQ